MTSIPPTDTPHQQFDYEAQTGAGQPLRGSLEAATSAAATTQLNALGLRVLSMTPAATTRAPKRLSADDFILFNQQLAHLTSAGLPVEYGLRLIASDLRSGRLSSAASAVAAELEKGASLQDAFNRHARQFPTLYARIIDAGVQSGNLPGLLFNLGRHLELTSRLRRALWRTLAYPAAVLTALCCILLFISIQILPQMKGVYNHFQENFFSEFQLPLLTRLLFAVGPKLPYVVAGIFVVVAVALIVVIIMRLTGKQGILVDRFVIPMPLVGNIVRRSILARWCHALRVGVEAGLDLPRALSLASQSVASERLAAESQSLVDTLARGEPIANLAGVMLPAAIPAAIEFGTRSGDLPSVLATLSSLYEQQADERVRALPAIITPLLMALIAVVIGLTVLALFLPLIRLIESFTHFM